MTRCPTIAARALNHLGVPPAAPDLALLDALVAAYVRSVPWESASRIVRRADTPDTGRCPRWPNEFWATAIERGSGGTCFESNYAFFALLSALGFSGHLTINNMGDTVGCHTAIVVRLDGADWLVDVGIPLYQPVPLAPDAERERGGPLMRYRTRPDGTGCYQVERWPHPKTNVFTLLAAPVRDEDYRAATAADYGPGGHFLDQVIVTRVVDGRVSRFASRETPARIETFAGGERADHLLDGDIPGAVAAHFRMDPEIVRRALELVAERRVGE
jgi:arylamine N-acetyltransferase